MMIRIYKQQEAAIRAYCTINTRQTDALTGLNEKYINAYLTVE